MRFIYNSLNGIPDHSAAFLRKKLDEFTGLSMLRDKLAICLYFMSDLSDEEHHLSNIETNLRKLYDEQYINDIVDFQSSNLRGVTNKDKNKPSNSRMFTHIEIESLQQGHWKNSELGNQRAQLVLSQLGIRILSGCEWEGYEDIENDIQSEQQIYNILEREGAEDYGTTQTRRRRGQGDFRADLVDAYSGKCCICGENCVELLEAAHIQEYIDERSNNVCNGLLLRVDFHKLYDRNLMYIDEYYVVHISQLIDNQEYRKFHGNRISIPINHTDHPNIEALRLREHIFRR